MIQERLVIIILLVLFAFPSKGQSISKGEQLYKKFQCVGCHGDKGQGSIELRTPRIGGQYDWYVESSLEDFAKKKGRQHPHVGKKMKPLNDKDRADLAAYIARL